MASSLLWIGNLQPHAEFYVISKILHRFVQRRIATILNVQLCFLFLWLFYFVFFRFIKTLSPS